MAEIDIVGDSSYKPAPCFHCGDTLNSPPRTSEAEHSNPDCPWFRRYQQKQRLRQFKDMQDNA